MNPAELQERIAEIEEQVKDGLLRRSEGNRKILALMKQIEEPPLGGDDAAAPSSELA